jgi:adenylosuccinate lyase
MEGDTYRSPLGERYAGRAMRENFSERRKFTTWRRLWVALAEAEKDLGLPITAEQVAELRARVDDVDLEAAAEHEKRLRHDVMAHIHAYGDQCPGARPILHLGATSCFVTDNAELIAMREGLRILRGELVGALKALRGFALEWRTLPTLGFTHFQPAQATTVGKRACLWIQDLAHDLEDLDHAEASMRFRGVKGTTGTQASFLALFNGDHGKVRELDRRVTAAMGFERTFGVTGQTYPRSSTSASRRCSRRSRSRPTSSRRTSACSRTDARSRSRSRRARSAPRRCPGSATRCGASGSAASRAS